MIAEHSALLATIRETPDDDTPRMVYADWLTENGFVEWADLIRCQCRLANPDSNNALPQVTKMILDTEKL